MRVDDLQLLYDYNYWARDRLLHVASQLGAADLRDPAGISYTSILGGLTHVLNAEWLWRVRCQESSSPGNVYFAGRLPPLDELKTFWREEERRMRNYLGSLEDAQLDGVVEYTRISGGTRRNTLWHILTHVVNHGTQHRSEIAVALTDRGFSPGDLDLIVFLGSE